MDLLSLTNGTAFEGFYLLRSAEVRTTQAGKTYVDLVLSDRSGSLSAKWWDGTQTPGDAGEVIKLRGTAQEYKGSMQIKVERVRKALPEDDVSPALFVPAAPDDAFDMLRAVLDRAEAIADARLRAITLALLERDKDLLLRAPAATNYHHSVNGGLLWHITGMLRGAEALCRAYPTLDADLLAAGVMIHDLAKMRELTVSTLGLAEDYSRDGILLGHIAIGVTDIAMMGEKLGTPEELVVMLQHMVLSHHGIPEYGSPRAPLFPEAEILHHLDVIDARMYDMAKALDATADGRFSERVKSLEGRRIYKKSAN